MTAKIKRNLFSSLKNLFRDRLIAIINALVSVILIVIVIFVLLSRASTLQRETSEESIVNLAGMTAMEVKTYYLTNYDVVRTLAQIMNNFETIEVERRRTFFTDVMQGLMNSNQSLVNLFSVWKPDELDGMDKMYANTEGYNETGQFMTGFTRERGWIEQRSFEEYIDLLEIEKSENSGFSNVIINTPEAKSIGLRETWVVSVEFLIYKNTETLDIFQQEHLVGIIGATINLNYLQYLIMSKRPFGTGRTMVCSEDGTLVAHIDPQLRGLSFSVPNGKDPMFYGGVSEQIYQSMLRSVNYIQPTVLTLNDSLIVSYPLRSIDLMPFSAYDQSGIPSWAVITTIPVATIMAPINDLLRFSILFTIGAGVVTALVLLFTSSSITQRARLLQRDLERATTMQDNLKYGLFLMDQKYVIQGVYSKALEKILAVSNLQGKSFTDLLTSSLKASEVKGLMDYLEMVFKRSFDEEMLEGINPINVFAYTSIETGETKNLRATFAYTERGLGTDYVLVTLEDITAEKELEKQLLDAQNLRDKEMQSLFQVIQLNPRVLSDFIEDTEFEFDKINDMLKNKTHFHREVLVEMYQSIHAVKSNALILNLETFSKRLHKLETSVKALQEKYEDFVPFDDFLSLVLELDDAMKEKDQLKTAISKIQNFKSLSGEEKDQERYVLVETLTQVCKKTQSALNKKVKLVVEAIDEAVLDHGPRRVIKEVLTQLVRNGVYHGIETPEDRESEGKDPEGEIKFSLRYIDNQIVLKFADDGKGINFDKIKQTAEAFNLFSNPDEINDRNFLLQLLFSPGFSTLDTADLHAGRGMGLNLVKDRIKELHGNLKVTTAVGKGTTFTITIPMELSTAAGSTVS